MTITQNLKDYLKSCSNIVNSNIILADLNKIILTFAEHDECYQNKTLSQDIRKLGIDWSSSTSFNNNYIMLNNNCLMIIDDDAEKYSAQLIFPIYHNNSLDGYLIFFRNNDNYVASSCKAPLSIREFVENMSTKDIN